MFFLIIFFFAVTQHADAHYESEACFDQILNVPGICCPLSLCIPAQQDLRLRLRPTQCSFDFFIPVVCCRAGCGDGIDIDAGGSTATLRPGSGGTSVRQGSSDDEGGGGGRISERMCAEYDKFLTKTRIQREAYYYYEYGNEEFQPRPEEQMYPDDTFKSSYLGVQHSSEGVTPYPSEPELPIANMVNAYPRESERHLSSDEAPILCSNEPEKVIDEAAISYPSLSKTKTREAATTHTTMPEISTSEAPILNTRKIELHTNAAQMSDMNEPELPNTSELQPIEDTTTGYIETTNNYPPAPVVYAAIGGVNTFVYEFPHMAALGWPLKGGGFVYNCGGTLVSEKFVMTAGHCLSNGRDTSLDSPVPTIVRLGDHNILDNVPDGADPINIPILRTFRHPNYRPPIKYFDIALVELQRSVLFSDHVHPACLWPRNTFDENKSAILTGWGTTISGGQNKSAILQKVDVDLLETSICQPLLQTSWSRNWQGFSDHQLCAGVLMGGKDACQGDSGGPLQLIIPGYQKKYHVIGVTAFGRECGKPNQPGVYTRVSAFIDWIESIVWPTAVGEEAKET